MQRQRMITGWVAVFSVVTLPGAVRAQEPLENWPGLDTSVLERVFVVDDAGAETAGRLLGLNPDSIVLLVEGAERRFEATGVRRIEKHGDSLRNGAITGLTVGGILGGLGAIAGNCEGLSGGGCAAARGSFAVILVGLFAAFGTTIDALVQGRTPLYVAPAAPAQDVPTQRSGLRSKEGAAISLALRW